MYPDILIWCSTEMTSSWFIWRVVIVFEIEKKYCSRITALTKINTQRWTQLFNLLILEYFSHEEVELVPNQNLHLYSLVFYHNTFCALSEEKNNHNVFCMKSITRDYAWEGEMLELSVLMKYLYQAPPFRFQRAMRKRMQLDC